MIAVMIPASVKALHETDVSLDQPRNTQAMKAVFADSFYFFALANPNDPAHGRAVAFVKTFTG